MNYSVFVSALVVAIALVGGAYLIGGRFEGHAAGERLYVVDRFTGAVRICSPLLSECLAAANED